MSKRRISALLEDESSLPKHIMPAELAADYETMATRSPRKAPQNASADSLVGTGEPARPTLCERNLECLSGSEGLYTGKAVPTPQNFLIEESLRYPSTQSDTYQDRIDMEEPFCEGYQFKLGFISSRGNEYFCEIDEEYLTDRFNLTGLNTEVQYYQYALDLVTDVFDLDCDDEMRETIEKSARHLYGLVHARYIVTTRGLGKMLDKYKKAEFGKCPRVMCKAHPLLPMGQSDNPNQKAVKLYCARCEDIYNPKSTRHAAIDGAYFGTSFHNILFQVYPALIPPKSYDRYIPRIYGFKVHASAALIRWQNSQRNDMRKRLRALEVESGFKEDEDDVDAEESEEEEEEVDPEAMVDNGMEGEFNDGML